MTIDFKYLGQPREMQSNNFQSDLKLLFNSKEDLEEFFQGMNMKVLFESAPKEEKKMKAKRDKKAC